MTVLRTLVVSVLAGSLLLLAAGCGPSAQTRALIEKDRDIKRMKEEQMAALQREEQMAADLKAREQAISQLAENNKTAIEQNRAVAAKALEIDSAQNRQLEGIAKQIADMEKKLGDGKQGGMSVTGGGANNIVIRVASSTFFEPGKAELKTSAHPMLDKVVATLKKQYSGNYIRVEGHTDSTPIVRSKDKWKDNTELSIARAKAVHDYLVKAGLPANRMYVAGYGEKQPLVHPEKTAEDRGKNRRVDIVILPNVQVERQTVASEKKPAAK